MAELAISITVTAPDAQKSINQLAKQLNGLGQVADNIKGRIGDIGSAFVNAAKTAEAGTAAFKKGMNDVMESIGKLDVESISKAESVAKSYGQLAKSLEGIGNIKPQSITAAKNNLLKLAPAAEELAKQSAGLKEFASAMAALPASMGEKEINLTPLTAAAGPLNSFTVAASRLTDGRSAEAFDTASYAIKKIAEATESLGNKGEKVNDLANGLKKLYESLTSFSHGGRGVDFTRGIESVRDALQKLSNTITISGEDAVLNPEMANSVYKLGDGLKSLNKLSINDSFEENLTKAGNALTGFIYQIPSERGGELGGLTDSIQKAGTAFGKINSVMSNGMAESMSSATTAIRQFLLGLSGVSTSVDQNAIKSAAASANELIKMVKKLSAQKGLEASLATMGPAINNFVTTVASAGGEIGVAGLSSLSDALSRLFGANVLGKASQLSSLPASGSAITSFLKQISGALNELNGGELESKAESLSKVISQLNRVNALAGEKGIASNLLNAGDAIKAFIERLGTLSQGMNTEGLANLGQVISSFSTKLGTLSNLGANNIQSNIAATAAAIRSLIDQLVSIPDSSVEKFERIANSLKIVSAAGRKAARDLSSVGKVTKNASLSSALAHTAFGKLASAFGRLLKYRVLRHIISQIGQAIKTGIDDIYQYSLALSNLDANQASGNMNELATSALYVKNALGAALMPIISAITPAINSLANAFAAAANAIGAFIRALGGKSNYTAAIRQATDYAEAAGGAGKAADELKTTLLGFDEINRLNDNNDSSGGGGSATPDYSGMFEEREIPQWIKELADKLREIWENVEERLTPAITRMKEAWERVGETWNKFWDSLTGDSNIESLIEDLLVLGGDVVIGGLTIVGDCLATILETLYALNTGDWSGVWKSLAQLAYDIIVLAADIIVGLTNIVMGCLIMVATSIDRLFGTHIADYLREDKKAFNETYEAMKQSDEGLFNLKDTLGLTEQKIDDATGSLESLNTNMAYNSEQASSCDGAYEFPLLQGAINLFDFFTDSLKVNGEESERTKEIWQNVVDYLNNDLAAFKEDIDAFFGAFFDPFITSYEEVKSFFETDWPQFWGETLPNAIEGFIDDSAASLSAFVDNVSEDFAGFKTEISEIPTQIETAWADVGDFFSGIADDIKSDWGNLMDWFENLHIPSFHFDGWSASEVNLGALGSFTVSLPKISWYKEGGFPSVGSMFIAGEAGPEFVGNIGGQTGVMNTDQMAESVAAGNERVVTLLVELIRAVNEKDFDVSLDGRSIADSVTKYQRQYARAAG